MAAKAVEILGRSLLLLGDSPKPYIHAVSEPLPDWQGGGVYNSHLKISQEGPVITLVRASDVIDTEGSPVEHTNQVVTFSLSDSTFSMVGDLGDGKGQCDLLTLVDEEVDDEENEWRYPGLLALNALADVVGSLSEKS